MKKLIFLIIVSCFAVPLLVLANGENKNVTYKPMKVVSVKRADSLVTVTLIPGSLKSNIERIAADNGWFKVVWSPDEDYTWATYTKIRNISFKAILQAILANYPLQAVFYQGNKVLLIQARTMR
jgi:hypothetical protein